MLIQRDFLTFKEIVVSSAQSLVTNDQTVIRSCLKTELVSTVWASVQRSIYNGK